MSMKKKIDGKFSSYNKWLGSGENGDFTTYMNAKKKFLNEDDMHAIYVTTTTHPEPPEIEWMQLGGYNGPPTIHQKINKKAEPGVEYKDVIEVSNDKIVNIIINRNNNVVKFVIQSDRLEALDKEYSGYGARQLYYNVDKEEKGLAYVTACSTLLGLQLHTSNIENKIKKEDIEEVNKLNSRALSLDRERDDEGFNRPGVPGRGLRVRLGDDWKKSVDEQDTPGFNWKLKGTNSNRL